MGPLLRLVGAWAVTTALVVVGVDAAIERVASDVSGTRPAPMTQSEVDAQLRAHHVNSTRASTGTTNASPPNGSPPNGSPARQPAGEPATPTTTGAPSSSPGRATSGAPRDVAGSITSGGHQVDVATTTVAQGSPGPPDERESPGRP